LNNFNSIAQGRKSARANTGLKLIGPHKALFINNLRTGVTGKGRPQSVSALDFAVMQTGLAFREGRLQKGRVGNEIFRFRTVIIEKYFEGGIDLL
jgi:hypothetical protein